MNKTYPVAALLFSALSGAAVPAERDTFAPFTLKTPFASDCAKQELKKWVPDITPEQLAEMSNVMEFGYRFRTGLDCPFANTAECASTKYFEMTRWSQNDLRGSTNRIQNEVLTSIRKDGCSSTGATGGLAGVTKTELHFRGGVSFTKNACGDWPWGGSWKTEVASGSGNWQAVLARIIEPNPVPKSSGEGNPGSIRYATTFGINVTSAEFFDIIDVDAFPGWMEQQIGKLVAKMLLDHYEDAAEKIGKDALHTMTSELTASTAATYADYKKTLSVKLGATPYYIEAEQTVFGGDPTYPTFTLTESAYDRMSGANTQYGIVGNMMQEIASWQDSTKEYVVVRGDSMWSIADKLYGHPMYYHFLAAQNRHVDLGKPLHVGMKLTVMPRYVFTRMLRLGGAVKVGENLWSKYTGKCARETWSRRNLASRLNLRNPDKLYVGQVIPELAATLEECSGGAMQPLQALVCKKDEPLVAVR